MRTTTAVVSVLACLALCAGPAWADGEDDPTFGNVGTSYIPLGDAEPLEDGNSKGFTAQQPRSDQAPDGAVITAVPLGVDDNERGSDNEIVRVTRMDASGVQSGLDGDGVVDLEYGWVNRLLDVEVLPDGRIVVVTENDGSASGRSISHVLRIRTLLPDGTEPAEGQTFSPPEDCDNSQADAQAGDVDQAGRVFVIWEDCEDDSVLARYTGATEFAKLLTDDGAVDLVLGPDGFVYLLAGSCCDSFPMQNRLGVPFSLVVRFGVEDLEFDDTYGDEGVAAAPGWPLDLAIDPKGRAVVWSDVFDFGGNLRGSSPEPWHFFRFDAGGDPDGSFGDGGWAAIEHPELGPLYPCSFFRGGCGGELPQIIAQADSKVIAIGYPPSDETPSEDRGGPDVPRQVTDRTIIRLGEGGALDPTWDGDGVRQFAMVQRQDGVSGYITLGPPLLQSDGKLILPFIAGSGQLSRVPTPPDGLSVGVSRIGLSPPPAVQQAAVAAAPVTVAASRTCISRRVFRIRLRTGRRRAERSAVKSAKVTVNGKNVPVTAGARRTAEVNLRNLPRGRFTVVIQMTLADGGKVRDVRRYRTCTPKQARELPGLRTRPPKSKRGGKRG